MVVRRRVVFCVGVTAMVVVLGLLRLWAWEYGMYGVSIGVRREEYRGLALLCVSVSLVWFEDMVWVNMCSRL